MLCTLIVLALAGFIVYQNFAAVKAWVEIVIAKAKGQQPPPSPPATPPV